MQELVGAMVALVTKTGPHPAVELEPLETAKSLLAYQDEHNEAKRSIYIAIGPNVWGRGYTEKQALDAACQESSAARKHNAIYRINDAWAYVDEMGNICYALGSTCELVAQQVKKGGRR